MALSVSVDPLDCRFDREFRRTGQNTAFLALFGIVHSAQYVPQRITTMGPVTEQPNLYNQLRPSFLSIPALRQRPIQSAEPVYVCALIEFPRISK
jgi:hypothetical protein